MSIITHPPILSAFMFALLNLTEGDAVSQVIWTVITLLTASVIPIVVVQYYSVKSGNTDGDVYNKEDRAKPLICGVLSYILGIVLLYAADAPHITTVMMISYAISTVLLTLISTRWKMSIHATGVTGPAISLSLTYPPWGYIVFILVPIVAWSRYVRRKHTPLQLIGGTIYGLVLTSAVLWALL